MNFTLKSQIVKSYAVFIVAGKMTIEDVPNVGNLRDVVTEYLTA